MREIDRPLTLSHNNRVFMPVIKIKTGSLARGSRCVKGHRRRTRSESCYVMQCGHARPTLISFACTVECRPDAIPNKRRCMKQPLLERSQLERQAL